MPSPARSRKADLGMLVRNLHIQTMALHEHGFDRKYQAISSMRIKSTRCCKTRGREGLRGCERLADRILRHVGAELRAGFLQSTWALLAKLACTFSTQKSQNSEVQHFIDALKTNDSFICQPRKLRPWLQRSCLHVTT